MPLTSIVIPVYNEGENIDLLYKEIKNILGSQIEIIWVDDGSTDISLQKISEMSANDSSVKCISFSRNFGHQAALIAGLHFAGGERIVIMDSDFQHPPQILPQFLQKLDQGYDIVSGKRNKTKNIGLIKKYSSRMYYKVINFLSDTHIEENVADFRVFNRRVLNAILQFEEKEIFLRGIFGWIGFKKAFIMYDAPERKYGQTKYSSTQMISLGLRGVISFSFKPLRVALLVGSVISFVSFILAVNAVIAYFNHNTVPGWTSIIIAIMFFGGIQLLFLGLIGEYITSLFIEVKKRPKYIIKETINVA